MLPKARIESIIRQYLVETVGFPNCSADAVFEHAQALYDLVCEQVPEAKRSTFEQFKTALHQGFLVAQMEKHMEEQGFGRMF